jgi:proteic killer suppression protein
MIVSYADPESERLATTGNSKKFQSVAKVALRKFKALRVAEYLRDLEEPPGNRLEKLKGDREGQYSIRVNEQHRICFEWIERDAALDGKPSRGDAERVEITDYH